MRDFVWDGKSDTARWKGNELSLTFGDSHCCLLSQLHEMLSEWMNGKKPGFKITAPEAQLLLDNYPLPPPIEMSALSLANSLPVKELGELA